MLEFKSRELKLTFNDKIYMLNYPTVDDIREYNKKLNKEDAVETDVVIEMLSLLGLPKNVSGKMEIPFIEEIITELTARKKK